MPELLADPDVLSLLEHGSHDQSTHGRKGGGSSSRGVGKISKTERDAVQDYSGDKFQSINGALRSGKVSGENERIVSGIDSFLEKSEKRPGASVRSFTMSDADESQIRGMLKEGGTFTDAAYISTRANPSVSDRAAFANKSAPAGRVVMRVDGKNGVDISSFSDNPGEGEVLYPRGTKFRVKKVIETPGGGILAEIEEL